MSQKSGDTHELSLMRRAPACYRLNCENMGLSPRARMRGRDFTALFGNAMAACRPVAAPQALRMEPTFSFMVAVNDESRTHGQAR